jgi:hypothetical protein
VSALLHQGTNVTAFCVDTNEAVAVRGSVRVTDTIVGPHISEWDSQRGADTLRGPHTSRWDSQRGVDTLRGQRGLMVPKVLM